MSILREVNEENENMQDDFTNPFHWIETNIE